MATLRILNCSGDDDVLVKAIADRFSDITIGALPMAIGSGEVIGDDEFTSAAIAITLAVAMAFLANVCPTCRSAAVDDFIEAFGKSLRASIKAQNLHDTETEGHA